MLQDVMQGMPLQEAISDILKAKWNHERMNFSLPPLMSLLLGEPGTGGSSTPSMVGSVKKWQKSDPQKSQETWRKLSKANSELETQLNNLSRLAKEQWDVYKCVIGSCSKKRSEKWIELATEPSKEAVVNSLFGARTAILDIRNHMRQMGEAAGIPIEPESQSQLLDATMNMGGVLLAGIPGAGGFDAIFAVTLGDSGGNVATAWSSLNVLALLVREDPRGVSLESSDPRTKDVTAGISAVHV
uniref:GHMP kinase C-terminal domain-containing protein n=1 Tax=Rhizophora mucronata TaxID=61149 RepID=A0A2P2J9D7_RHIMU